MSGNHCYRIFQSCLITPCYQSVYHADTMLTRGNRLEDGLDLDRPLKDRCCATSSSIFSADFTKHQLLGSIFSQICS